MSRCTRACVLAAAAALVGCSLLTDLSGLSGSANDAGSASPGIDAAGDAAAGASDANVDAASADAGVVADPDASWSFISSSGFSKTSISSSKDVIAGDLVIFGCDTSTSAGAITFDGLAPNVVAVHVVGPVSGGDTQAIAAWGIIGTPPSGGVLTVTAKPTATPGYIDCTLNTYRGGTPQATLVDSRGRAGTGAGLVTCGQVGTRRGGVAFYVAVRDGCAGTPLQFFTQRQDLEGNPNGDAVPTDGGKLETDLADCSGSTGDWTCLTLSISP